MICPACGLVDTHYALCPRHSDTGEKNWALINRIWCDLIHRGIIPVRLSPQDRNDEDYWTAHPSNTVAPGIQENPIADPTEG